MSPAEYNGWVSTKIGKKCVHLYAHNMICRMGDQIPSDLRHRLVAKELEQRRKDPNPEAKKPRKTWA